jgi:3'-phosphoadenosine 5'-phosphosulfate sulfotransferase (PAPS reductase)/FAD synthetase
MTVETHRTVPFVMVTVGCWAATAAKAKAARKAIRRMVSTVSVPLRIPASSNEAPFKMCSQLKRTGLESSHGAIRWSQKLERKSETGEEAGGEIDGAPDSQRDGRRSFEF